MKRKLLSLALALVMCLGLSIPALASDSSDEIPARFAVGFPDGYDAEKSVTESFQIREVSGGLVTIGEHQAYVIARADKAASYSIPVLKLTLGAKISVRDLRSDWKSGQADVVSIRAYSDPDGDGVYDQWIYSFTDDPPVVPLTENGVSFSVEENGRYSYAPYLTKDNTLGNDVNTLPDSVTVTTDYLNEVFGPNTLLMVTINVWTAVATDPLTAFPTETSKSMAFLLTGESASAPEAGKPAETEKPTETEKPAQPAAAVPTSAPVLVNGKQTAFDAYEINGNNYFKLRDLAYVLNGTDKQFEVSWDEAANAIVLTSGQPYTAQGGEMASKGAGNKAAVPTTSKILLDGKEVALTAYNINDNNYFKLRDIGAAFDFGVDWDAAAGTIRVDTTKGYTPD